MSARSLLVLVALAGGALADRSPAQCLLPGHPSSASGSIDGARAVFGTGPAITPPRIVFYRQRAGIWEPDGEGTVGDLAVFLPTVAAIDGERAIGGASEANGLSGAATIFDRVGGTWVPTPLAWTSTGPSEFFGAAVAVDGDLAVVGADHLPIGGGDGRPLAHVFEFDGVSWNEAARLPHFDRALDVDAGTIVIGNDGWFPGHVAVHEKVGGAWIATQRLGRAAGPQEPRLGGAVAVDGDLLVAGAAHPLYLGASGRVEVFRRIGGSWSWAETLAAPPPSAMDGFGASVALDGRTLLVGAPHSAGGGRIHRFEHDGTRFVPAGSFDAGGAIHGFGGGIAFDGEDAILGSEDQVTFWRLGFARLALHCPTTPNSTGAAGALAVEGCDSLAGARMTLVANSLPRNVLVEVACGPNAAQLPFGDGWRCVGFPFLRFPPGTSDGAGSFALDVDFGSEPASRFAVGRTFHFQAFHRDPASAGARLNATNAVAIGFVH